MGGRGFTLIELLIVIGIIGLTLSLVGPLTVGQLESAQRTQEREQLHRHLQHWQFNATHWRLPLQLEFEGRHLRVLTGADPYRETQVLARYEYDYIRFPQQNLVVNANGYWSHDKVIWRESSRNGEREFDHEKELINRGLTAYAN